MEMTLQVEEMYKDGHKERVCWAVGRQGSQWGTSREKVVQEGWRGSRARSQAWTVHMGIREVGRRGDVTRERQNQTVL